MTISSVLAFVGGALRGLEAEFALFCPPRPRLGERRGLTS